MLFLKHLSNHHSPPKALSTALRGRSDYSISGSDFHCQLYYLLTISLHSLHELLANLQIPQAPWTRLTLFLLSGMPSLCPCSFHLPPPYGLLYESLWTYIIFPLFLINLKYIKIFFNFIRMHLIYNIVLVSSIKQSDSVMHIHMFILLQILCPYRLSQTIE